MKKYVLPPLLAAVAMFLFGAIYWMSPFPYKALGHVANDQAVADGLTKLFPATDAYIIPGPYLDEKVAAPLWERGPSATVFFVREGHAMMEPGVFAEGFIHYFVVALLLTLLLHRIRPTFVGYCCVVKSSVMIGLIGAVLCDFSDPIWWHHPWGWHLVSFLYNVLEFLVAGLVLGIFLKPTPAPAPASAA